MFLHGNMPSKVIVQRTFLRGIVGFLTPEEGTAKLSRNVVKKLPILAA